MNLKRILAATDFSPLGDAAIHRAALLAAREDSELLIAHAMPRRSVLDDVFGADGDLPARMRADAEARLAAPIQTATPTGAKRVRGEIVRYSGPEARAAQRKMDGGSRVEEAMIGSITRFLAYYAPCDVLVV